MDTRFKRKKQAPMVKRINRVQINRIKTGQSNRDVSYVNQICDYTHVSRHLSRIIVKPKRYATSSSENESLRKRKNAVNMHKKIISTNIEKEITAIRKTLENVSPNINGVDTNKKTLNNPEYQIASLPMQHTEASVENNLLVNASQTHLEETSSTQSYCSLIGCASDQQVEIRDSQPYNPQSTCRTEGSGQYSPYTYTQLAPNNTSAVSEVSRSAVNNVALPTGYSSCNKMDYSNEMEQCYDNPARVSRMFESFTVRPPVSIPHTITSQYMSFSDNSEHRNSMIPCDSSARMNVQERTEWSTPNNNVTLPERNEINLGNLNKFHDNHEEMRRLREKVDNLNAKMDNMMTKEHFEVICKKLDKLIRRRINVMPPKPQAFPLTSVEEVNHFNDISDEDYENVVKYFKFLGGLTLHDTIKYCFKEGLTDETIRHFSAWGERGNLPLSTTKLIKAIYDAVSENVHYPPPTREEFFREIGEAVRFGKQRYRNAISRKTAIEIGRRQRMRHAANELLEIRRLENDILIAEQ